MTQRIDEGVCVVVAILVHGRACLIQKFKRIVGIAGCAGDPQEGAEKNPDIFHVDVSFGFYYGAIFYYLRQIYVFFLDFSTDFEESCRFSLTLHGNIYGKMKKLFLYITGLLFAVFSFAQQIRLEDITAGKYSAKQIRGITPMADGETYAQISADGRRIERHSFKTGALVETVIRWIETDFAEDPRALADSYTSLAMGARKAERAR